MEFGAPVWPFCWKQPYEEAIKRIARLGFKGVELIGWTKKDLDEYYTPGKIAELTQLIESLGLTLSEFVSTPRKLGSLKAKENEEAIAHFGKLVETGKQLGTKIVNTVSPWPFDFPPPNIMNRPLQQTQLVKIPPGTDWKAIWNNYVDAVGRCCDLAGDAGLKYALEPHPYRLMSNADSMLRLIEDVDSNVLGMNFDPSHLYPVGEIPSLTIYKLEGRIFHTHFSDNDGTTNAHWRPGQGKIDWTDVLRALKNVGYDGFISIELEDVPGAAHSEHSSTTELDEEYTQSKEYLRGLAKTLGITIEG